MVNFELVNENADDWEELEFLTHEAGVAAYLVVDWGAKEAEVENMPVDNCHRGQYVCDSISIFELDTDVDFSRFKEFYYNTIQPTLVMMDKEIERQWVNKINVLDVKHGDVEGSKKIGAWYNGVFNFLVAAPAHNFYIAWCFSHITDYYEEEGGLIGFLENNGLDFSHVSLTHEICRGIIGHLERDGIKVMMPFNTFVKEIKRYQALYQ